MGKLCKDQLIGKLVAPVRLLGLGIQLLLGLFDRFVKLIRVGLSQEGDLEKLFDSQIATLKNRGVPEQIIEALQNQKGAVVEKASKMTIGEGNIPFLPVIKPAYLGYYGLMSMVRNGDKQGYCYLNRTAITDEIQTPDELYYIYDVEDGEATRGKSPEKAIDIFKKQSRLALTVAEAVNLCIITDVLSRHYVWAAGSRYGGSDGVPGVYRVYLDCGDQPELYWGYLDSSDDHWGSASCGSR